MILVAGPPGSGKSSLFSPYNLGIDAFNADDRAAVLNGGSYQAIPPAIRAVGNREFEDSILSHISGGVSFGFETTLRSEVERSPTNVRWFGPPLRPSECLPHQIGFSCNHCEIGSSGRVGLTPTLLPFLQGSLANSVGT